MRTMLSIALYFFLIAGFIAALYAVIAKTVVKAIFSMFAAFFAVSAVLVFLSAEFLALSHLMIYIGGIIVVMVFGIMLSTKDFQSDSVIETAKSNNKTALFYTKIFTGIGALILFLFFCKNIISQTPVKNVALVNNDIKEIGKSIFAEYTIAFELISIVLLIALMGVSIINRKEQSHAD